MKRTALLITFIIIVLITGGIWFYQSVHQEKITPWNLIGNDAALVFEITNFNSFKQKIISLPSLKEIVSSGSGKKLFNSKLLETGKVFLSFHFTSRDDFGTVAYLDINSIRKKSDLAEFSKALQSEFTSKKRIYNGIEINEFTKNNTPVLSFAEVDQILVISESSFLLEGALRLRTANPNELFKNSNALLYKLPTLQSDDGNVYLNVSNFISSTKLFLQPESKTSNLIFLGGGLADMKVSENRVLMNGFIVDASDDILSLFKDQLPQPVDIEQLVSNKVAALVHFGLSDPMKWFDDQALFLKKFNIKSVDSLEKELSRLSVSLESIRKSIGNQLANCYLGTDDVVSIIKVGERQDQISVFEELASKISTQKKDSLYLENYAGYNIGLIDYRNFLDQLFYPLGPLSEQSFFVRIGSYILFSENVELIKTFIDDIDNENTWGKTVDWNKFFSTSLQESNINLFFDGKLTSIFLRNQFNAKWRPFFDSTYFVGVDKGSAQLSRLESNFYLNASLQFSEPPVKKSNRSLEQITVDLGDNVVLPAKIVRNHISKDIEVIVQDSLNNLYLLTRDLKVQWKQQINGRIMDDIEQLDFYSNNKLQYFFTTSGQIYLMDRLGRYVDGFPAELKSSGFEYSTVVDYDRSKRYRYLMTDTKGNLLLTDKKNKPLEGWNPRPLNGKMLVAAKHNRILGKDYFFAVQQNGTVNLLNRRGEMLKGFPMELGYRPSGNFFINVGSSLSSTFITVVSKDGSQIDFGLNGQVRRKEALLKRTGSSQFTLVKSISGDSYVFLRVDPGKIAIQDAEGKVLIEIENTGSTNWELAYLENRLKERFYCLFDHLQNFSYIYSSEGRPLLSQPLESTQMPSLYYDEKQKGLSLYNVFNSRLNVISIKK